MLAEIFKIGSRATLKTYLWEPSEELEVLRRPAVLIFPGGAYMMCSDREAEPIALAYMAEGFQTFVLKYTTDKDFSPAFEEAQEALALIRSHAEEWAIDPARVAVCGFSAGGHLACAMGVMAQDKPNAMVLGYPAVIGEDWRKLTDKIPDIVSQVNPDTAPAFIFACRDDKVVRIHNSVALLDALDSNRIPFECHIFREGGHGFSLAKRHTSSGDDNMTNPRAAEWFGMSVAWLKEVMGDVVFAEKAKLPDNLAPAIHVPILKLTGNPRTYSILLKYSQAFANEQLLAMAGETPLSAVVLSLGLSNKEIMDMAEELQQSLDGQM